MVRQLWLRVLRHPATRASHLREASEHRGADIGTVPSPGGCRRWSWATLGHSHTGQPWSRAAQPGCWQLLQAFDLSFTTLGCKSPHLLESSATANQQVIKQHFYSKTVKEPDGLGMKKYNFSDFKWQQLIALLYLRCSLYRVFCKTSLWWVELIGNIICCNLLLPMVVHWEEHTQSFFLSTYSVMDWNVLR